jgi:N6-adenosine-specific RNA methylase IME4
MEPIKVTGVIESLDWDDRGVGRLKLANPDVPPVYVKELQKFLLPKGLKKGDLVTVAGNLDRDCIFLTSIERGEAASAGSADQNGFQTQSFPPLPEQPPETNLAFSLKEQLDRIDEKFGQEIYNGFYESRLKIEIGMWQKGKAVSGFRGVNTDTSYRDLAKLTGRNNEDLKRWNDLYDKYRDYDRFLKEHAEPTAKAWTEKVMRQRGKLQSAETHALPSGKFAVIYADPPWQYEFSKSESRSIEAHYSTLTTDQICSLKIPANDDAVLFLWSPAPKIEDALTVMTAWRFRYLTHFVWTKDKIGMGYWARAQHELLLVGDKGEVSPPNEATRFPSVVSAPRLDHSAKPPVFYEMIEKMFPDQKKIELFARGPERKGWVFWGIEVEQ